MTRLFPTHQIRPQTELAGLWDFFKGDVLVPGQEPAPGLEPLTLPVPGCWEQHPHLRTWRGIGWYRRTVQVSRTGPVRLEFKGASHSAQVFWDGREIGRHYNAYTPFSCVFSAAPGLHEILVRVDNSFGEHSALHIGNDYYTYGGLIRGVLMEEPGTAMIEHMAFTPHMDESGRWTGRIQVGLRHMGSAAREVQVRVRLMDMHGSRVKSEADLGLTILPPESEHSGPVCIQLDQSISCPGVQAWEPGSPKLYLVQVLLEAPEGHALDDLVDRVGFREVTVRGREIRLNGKPVCLKGFNRHEDMGLLGASVPFQMMHHDLSLMADLGCNTVRTSHYPNDELFLDLCDQMGFMVWEENHARGLSLDQMKHPLFEAQCHDCNREMVQNHINHPSIIIWGLLNECASNTPEGRVMYQKQFDQIRAMDKSRPMTLASCHLHSDLCLDLCDIVSMNVYSGWYNDNPVEETWNGVLDYINSHGGADKPILISEFGAAGLYGWRDPGREKWSEERQADIIAQSIEVYSRRPEIQGLLIWQFADCRVTEGSFYARPRCHNNKGIVDDYRRPKLAYQSVKASFRNLVRP